MEPVMNPDSTLRARGGFTLIELCIVIAVLGVLMVIGVTSLMRARMASNETSAVGGLRATASAQLAYSSGCGRGYYATSYPILGTQPAANSQGYISEDLGSTATPSRNGYTFALGLGAGGAVSFPDCNGNPTQSAYYASARPNAPGTTGDRSFAVNQLNSIYQSAGAIPPTEPFGPPSLLVQ